MVNAKKTIKCNSDYDFSKISTQFQNSLGQLESDFKVFDPYTLKELNSSSSNNKVPFSKTTTLTKKFNIKL